MSQSGFTPIQLYRTSTAAAVPTAGNLAAGELAINLTDEALYFKNAAGVVKLLADSSGALGTVTSVDVSGGTTGLTTSGGPITTSGTITLAGTLAVGNGGTGTATAFTAGSVVFAGASGVYTQDNANLFWDNSNDRLGIGTASPGDKLTVEGTNVGVGISGGTGSAGSPAYTNLNFRGFSSNRTAVIRSFDQSGSFAASGGLEFLVNQNMLADTMASVMRITADLNVGIGTSSPAERLDVAGNAKITSGSSFYWGDATSQITAVNGGAMRFLVGNGGEKVRIDASGNVGIGTTTTTAYFTNYTSVRNSGVSGAALGLEVGGQPRLLSAADNSSSYISSYDDNPIVFSVTSGNFAGSTGTERMRIDSSGNVGIGGSSPGTKFYVNGGVAIHGASFPTSGVGIEALWDGTQSVIQSYNRNVATYQPLRLDGSALQLFTSGTEKARITSSGTLLINESAQISYGGNVPKLEVLGASVASTDADGGTVGVIGSTNTAGAGGALVLGSLFQTGAWATFARVRASKDTSTSGEYGGGLAFDTRPNLGNLTQRMLITSAGDVGIGTSSPVVTTVQPGSITANGVLAVKSFLSSHQNDVGIIEYNTGKMTLRPYGNSPGTGFIAFNTGGGGGSGDTERARIDASGNLLVGTTNADNRLTVSVSSAGAAAGVLSVVNPNDGAGTAADLDFVTHSSGTLATGRIRGVAVGADDYALAFSSYGPGGIAERMRITGPGNVGIGTTAPARPLTVSAGAGLSVLAIQDANTGSTATDGFQLQLAGNGDGYLWNYENANMVFGTNNTERARITSAGTLFINSTDNGFTSGIKLSVTAAAGEGAFLFKNDAGNNQWNGWVWNTATTGDNLFINFLTEAGGTSRGSITYNRAGGLVAYNVTSDYRAKDIIGPVTDAGATIDALKVYNGKMKGATIARPMLVAHEAQEVVPYAVTGEKDAVNEDGTDKHQQMDHQSFIPLLIAEIQSLRARVAQLEGN